MENRQDMENMFGPLGCCDEPVMNPKLNHSSSPHLAVKLTQKCVDTLNFNLHIL